MSARAARASHPRAAPFFALKNGIQMHTKELLVVACLAICAAVNVEAGEMRRIAMSDPEVAATERGRMNLKYLVSCALDSDTVMVAETSAGTFEFPGAMGLAPQWPWRGLNAVEERWVSACIGARTNFYGAKVQISQRSPFPTQAHGLQWDESEARDFPLQDGTFFGNIFKGQGEQYVCGANDTMERRARLAAHRRICALPAGKLDDGRQYTACGMVYVGACTAEAFTQNGVTYREAITVFLPETPRTQQ
jgi:hypothetical protein